MATGETGIQTIVLHELTSRVVRKQLELLIIDLKLPSCRNVLKRYYRLSLVIDDTEDELRVLFASQNSGLSY